MKREIGIFMLVVGAVAGCAAKGNSCVPGQSAGCACSDGTTGAQVCRSDGTFGACACGVAGNNGGGEVDMATGGVGGNGGGDMAGAAASGSKRLFVTSTSYAGTVARSICQSVADSVGLKGTWVAWLSDSNLVAGSSNPPDAINIIKGSGPWLLLDGHVAFANHAQLATAPSVPINVTENAQTLPGSLTVWTGTLTGGVHSGSDCNGWSSSSFGGDVGSTGSPSQWTAAGISPPGCSSVARVYCFEQ